MTICIKQPEATSHFNPLGKDTPNQAGLISHTQNENWYPGTTIKIVVLGSICDYTLYESASITAEVWVTCTTCVWNITLVAVC